MTKITKRKKPRRWVERIPVIAKMMKTMTDKEIADVWKVKRRTIRSIRFYYGLFRNGETIPVFRVVDKTPNRPQVDTRMWDFSDDNLPLK